MKKIFLLFVITMMSISVNAQKDVKEGVITMKMSMFSDNPQVNASLSMMGDMALTVYFKGNKSRSEMSNPMTGENTTIVDNDVKKIMVMMNNPTMGKKYKIKPIEVSEEDLKNVTITDKSESKTILGYNCKGYDVVVKKDDKEVKMTMFVTDKINAPTQNSAMFGDKLKGYPLSMEIAMEQMGMPMVIKMDVTKIEETSVADAKFDMSVPEGYEEIEDKK